MENKAPERKPRVLSLIQPTAVPTIGNYFGALKNWKAMSEDYDCLFGVAEYSPELSYRLKLFIHHTVKIN